MMHGELGNRGWIIGDNKTVDELKSHVELRSDRVSFYSGVAMGLGITIVYCIVIAVLCVLLKVSFGSVPMFLKLALMPGAFAMLLVSGIIASIAIRKSALRKTAIPAFFPENHPAMAALAQAFQREGLDMDTATRLLKPETKRRIDEFLLRRQGVAIPVEIDHVTEARSIAQAIAAAP